LHRPPALDQPDFRTAPPDFVRARELAQVGKFDATLTLCGTDQLSKIFNFPIFDLLVRLSGGCRENWRESNPQLSETVIRIPPFAPNADFAPDASFAPDAVSHTLNLTGLQR
jgi:hypothetical protein